MGDPSAATVALFPTPVRRPRILRITNLSFIILLICLITTISFIVIAQRQNLQRIYSKPSPLGFVDRPGEGLDHPRFVAASPGVISPLTSAAVTACIAAEMSSVLSIGGEVNLTARSRHGGRIRSMQSRIAVGSPASASSTAMRVRAADSPREKRCGGECRLIAEPSRRPAGLPDRPFSNGRPRARPGSFCNTTSDMVIPLVRPAASFLASRSWSEDAI
jgi:hypothetical protein